MSSIDTIVVQKYFELKHQMRGGSNDGLIFLCLLNFWNCQIHLTTDRVWNIWAVDWSSMSNLLEFLMETIFVSNRLSLLPVSFESLYTAHLSLHRPLAYFSH